MNDTDLSTTLNSLFDRPVADMTDAELTLWFTACEVMERKVNPAKARRDWTSCRAEAEEELARRRTSADRLDPPAPNLDATQNQGD